MTAYLLGLPEYYCSHDFQALSFRPAMSLAVPAIPEDVPALLRQTLPTGTVAALLQPTTSSTDPIRVVACQPHDDYLHRGASLASWPWYFYAAGVRAVPLQHRLDPAEKHLFDAEHPKAERWAQQIITRQAWRVPLLQGPNIPAQDRDPAGRAMMLLLLFRPWLGGPGSVARCSDIAAASYAARRHSLGTASCNLQSGVLGPTRAARH